LPRTVTGSDYDLGNGTYDLVLALAQLHLVVKFGKALREQPAAEPAAPEEPPAEQPQVTSPAADG
jgi:long-chain fatty acid transport protein